MHGGAVTLAEEYLRLNYVPDLIVATDMLDLATFLGLTREKSHGVPVALYLHENQLTYPWSDNDQDVTLKRDNHYAFVNYTSALAADKIHFNSEYHRSSFLKELPSFLRQFPDNQNLDSVGLIDRKSDVLHLGMDLSSMVNSQSRESQSGRAVILWNHRWEYDKNPDEFFQALFEIQRRGWDFKLVVLGEKFARSPSIFGEAKERLSDHILHWGYVKDRSEYVRLVSICDILPVTSNQDFFGGSVVEAMYLNVKPLLPKRLAYQEHIPKEYQEVFHYGKSELADKLQRWIKDVSVLRKQQTRQFVQKYDWRQTAVIYDQTFNSL